MFFGVHATNGPAMAPVAATAADVLRKSLRVNPIR
jgi:hypothetical protein